MNFAQMLMMEVHPLPSEPERKPKAYVRTVARVEAFETMHDGRHIKSFNRYRDAMGDEWLTTKAVETRLGYTPGTVGATLTSWLNRGLMERRPVGGVFNRKWGWEWRMK